MYGSFIKFKKGTKVWVVDGREYQCIEGTFVGEIKSPMEMGTYCIAVGEGIIKVDPNSVYEDELSAYQALSTIGGSFKYAYEIATSLEKRVKSLEGRSEHISFLFGELLRWAKNRPFRRYK